MNFSEEYYNSKRLYDRETINKAYAALMEELNDNVSRDYVPVEFFLNTLFSGLDDDDIDKYAYLNE
ncbi:MAG: hypothetical protein OSJ65_05130 [Bacilli bacterium]|nr:hypothetical protein [Bacilli bacterium]